MRVVEAVGDRCIEVLLVDQQMVGRCLKVALYQVSVNRQGRSNINTTIGATIVIRAVRRIDEVVFQHIICSLIDFSRRSIDEQVVRLTRVDDVQQSVLIVEQWRIEQLAVDTQCPCVVVMTCKVDSRHLRICVLQVSRLSYQISIEVIVSHTLFTAPIVCRSTIDTVTEIGGQQTSTALHDVRRLILMRT